MHPAGEPVVKTEKPAKIRATFLLSLFNREGLGLCELHWCPHPQ
jgi:hypothetical protein